MDGWIYLRSLVLKEHRQSDANNENHPENRTTRKAFQIEKEVLDIKPVIEVPRVIPCQSLDHH